MIDDRLKDLRRFYRLLDQLLIGTGGPRTLGAETSAELPRRGVYFFFESGEIRTDSGRGHRVVRVGTHAVSRASTTSLRQRLNQHRGVTKHGGGNHRGSIFRLCVGEALAERDRSLSLESWGKGNSASEQIRLAERRLEIAVSDYVRAMPFVCLKVDDESTGRSQRARIESNVIALLSNFGKMSPLDAPSRAWLGLASSRQKIRESGLWNSRDVNAPYDPSFLEDFESLVVS